MQDVMEGMIGGESGRVTAELRREIAEYIDSSTGILSIYQMRWLAEAVARWKLTARVLSAGEYKRIYNERLLERKVYARLKSASGEEEREKFLLRGAKEFLKILKDTGAELLLASGTDDVYVQREASFLGVRDLFEDRIYGALDDTEEYTKENIIRRILKEDVAGSEGSIMAVFGDGPVEIRAAREYGALAVGVASDEERGRGWNPKKVRRLAGAGADILIPDFAEGSELLALIRNSGMSSSRDSSPG